MSLGDVVVVVLSIAIDITRATIPSNVNLHGTRDHSYLALNAIPPYGYEYQGDLACLVASLLSFNTVSVNLIGRKPVEMFSIGDNSL
jgi:hypothetical protein